MRPFAYERATDPDGARALLAAAGPGARYLGGGTNLVDLMKLGVEAPGALVDVAKLPLATIELGADGALEAGAAVTNTALANDPRVRAGWPVLSQALLAGASGQLRNLATVGGNLLQRTRCAYFQDITKACNKREGGRDRDGCPARDGDHRNLAILGHSEACVATHPSDMAVALTALGATVRVRGDAGDREIPMPGLHRLPGDDPTRDTVLEPGDLILGVSVPPLADGARSTYVKVRDRASYAFAVVSIAAVLDRDDDGTVRDVRIALGGVAHAPWRAERAEAILRDGASPDDDLLARAADAELSEARPLRDNAYKIPLARHLIVDTIKELM
ncbi:MAG TPA: xanthine dehydrogenase family protein subunit M [Baekduia sp.]|uniref:FAD binding domain-containing protein n=1 Tax=Baekduia sp. TaxID=2600305 RepID=UPI002D79F90B|nr:xanthine dehydrogenase family protein subunit M [Baekduia sp.]HET6508190.1 xanthine dehydrogenase family protein subunit M [Baekduia sp.]